jgi:hypothetical protein
MVHGTTPPRRCLPSDPQGTVKNGYYPLPDRYHRPAEFPCSPSRVLPGHWFASPIVGPVHSRSVRKEHSGIQEEGVSSLWSVTHSGLAIPHHNELSLLLFGVHMRRAGVQSNM